MKDCVLVVLLLSFIDFCLNSTPTSVPERRHLIRDSYYVHGNDMFSSEALSAAVMRLIGPISVICRAVGLFSMVEGFGSSIERNLLLGIFSMIVHSCLLTIIPWNVGY